MGGAFRDCGRSRVVEHDEIDVAGIVELERAVLPKREHKKARLRRDIFRTGMEP